MDRASAMQQAALEEYRKAMRNFFDTASTQSIEHKGKRATRTDESKLDDTASCEDRKYNRTGSDWTQPVDTLVSHQENEQIDVRQLLGTLQMEDRAQEPQLESDGKSRQPEFKSGRKSWSTVDDATQPHFLVVDGNPQTLYAVPARAVQSFRGLRRDCSLKDGGVYLNNDAGSRHAPLLFTGGKHYKMQIRELGLGTVVKGSATFFPLTPSFQLEASEFRRFFTMLIPPEEQAKLFRERRNKYGTTVTHSERPFGVNDQGVLAASTAIEDQEPIWRSYFASFTNVKESVTDDPYVINFQVELDLNPFCAYGRNTADLMSK